MGCLVFIKLYQHSSAEQLKKAMGTRLWLMATVICIVTLQLPWIIERKFLLFDFDKVVENLAGS